MDSPVWLYERGFGPLFGSRLVVLVHRGRKTGIERRTTLEVLEHRRVAGEYRVLSAWGRTSDWYRNLAASPPIALLVGRSRYRVTHRVLAATEAAAAVRGHLTAYPRVSARLTPELMAALPRGDAALAAELENTAVVAFRPIADTAVGGVGLPATLEGIGRMAAAVVATPFSWNRRLRWGATTAEALATLPGDALVPSPKWSFTYAVDIAAPPEAVWPWIAQIGQGRGGFYSYQGLENLFGCQIQNVSEILPEHQHPGVGDGITLHPDVPPMRIEVADPPHALVLLGEPGDVASSEGFGMSTWQFALAERPEGATRLFMRGRSDYSSGLATRLAYGRLPLEPILHVMSRKMLLEIKRLAEGGAAGES